MQGRIEPVDLDVRAGVGVIGGEGRIGANRRVHRRMGSRADALERTKARTHERTISHLRLRANA